MDVTDPGTVRTGFLDTYAGPDRPHPYREYEQYTLVVGHRERHPRMAAVTGTRRVGLPPCLAVAPSPVRRWFADIYLLILVAVILLLTSLC